MWRCGCGACEYRVDFTTRDDAEEAARLHNDKEHGGKSSYFYAKVYAASWWRRFEDYGSDHD